MAHRHASVTHWACDCDTLLGRMWPPLTTCLYSSLCFYLNLHFFVQNLDLELMQDRLHSRMFFCVYFSCRISTLKSSTRPLSVSFLIRIYLRKRMNLTAKQARVLPNVWQIDSLTATHCSPWPQFPLACQSTPFANRDSNSTQEPSKPSRGAHIPPSRSPTFP